jgi:hypothetical protein
MPGLFPFAPAPLPGHESAGTLGQHSRHTSGETERPSAGGVWTAWKTTAGSRPQFGHRRWVWSTGESGRPPLAAGEAWASRIVHLS